MQLHSQINRDYLVGEWVFEYIRHFAEKKLTPGQKVLLKIEHMSPSYIQAIIETIENQKNTLANSLEIVLKTVQKIDGFDHLQTKENETIVWLRNNIAPNQVVILILNEERPEGQSLKDAVAVDETALLSEEGFLVFKQLLRKYEYLDVAKIDALMRFIDCYQSVTDMQLSTLVNFIVDIIKNPETDINTAIGQAYPALSMFKVQEVNMSNKVKFISSLRKNHNLSSLRKSITQLLDIDRLMTSVEKFLKTERENDFPNNIWSQYKRNDEFLFKQDVEDFLYRKNKNLLKIYFSDAEKIFNFKESHKLKDKLRNFQETIEEDYAIQISQAATPQEREKLEQQKLRDKLDIMDGIEAIDRGKDLEAIREFREKFEEQLSVANLTKKIQTIENKLENPALYKDLIEAVLTESITLLEDIESEDFIGDIHFELNIINSDEINKNLALSLNFHLKMLNSFIDSLNVQLVDSDVAASTMPEQIRFELQLYVDEKQIETARFTFNCERLQTQNTSFYEFARTVISNEHIGYIEKKEDIAASCSFDNNLEQLQTRLRISGDESIAKHIQYFQQFQQDYERIALTLLSSNYDKSIFAELEDLLKSFLAKSYEDIKLVRDIYQMLNQMASVIELDTTSKILSYRLSLLNPMRLIGYMSRYVRLNNIFNEHLNTTYGRNRILDIDDIKKYREYLLAKLGEVPPAYITNESTDGIFFLETEYLGEGVYRLLDSAMNASDKAETFASEVQKVTNDYLKVYPFSGDSLNILFMYVSNEEYITKSIDLIFKDTNVSKLNVSIYSRGQAALLYKKLNQWIQNREDYLIPLRHLGGLPKLEINIVSYEETSDMFTEIQKSLSDYNLAFFVNFLNSSSSATMLQGFYETPVTKCKFEDEQWAIFDEIGYINAHGGSRHINYVADHLPEVLMDFYELQYMINRFTKREKNNQIQLLKSEITPAKNEQNELYNRLHSLFNWVVAYDKYIDPLFAQQIAHNADIIKYSIVQKSTQDIKLLISSSENVNRLVKDTDNYYYHDRLANRLIALLGIENLDNDIKEDIIRTVKKLSGASILKSLGPGVFTNELLSIYLTLSREEVLYKDDGCIHIWFSCDELSWFRTKSKRPDLLHIIISPNLDTKMFNITFRLVELKLISRNSYDAESTDAQVQLNSGVETLKKAFEFKVDQLNTRQGLETFFEHLMQSRPYTDAELEYMKYLRLGSDWSIEDFKFEKQADIYMYSHDNAFPEKKQISPGHYQDAYDNLIVNTFTRSHILNALHVAKADAMEEIEEIDVDVNFDNHFIALGLKEDADENNTEDSLVTTEHDKVETNETNEQPISEVEIAQPSSIKEHEEGKSIAELDKLLDQQAEQASVLTAQHNDALYPEIQALASIPLQNETLAVRMQKAELLAENYKRTLEHSFRENNVQLKIINRVIGANIIRMYGKIPLTERAASITSKTKEMGLWLQVPSAPLVTVAENIVIDISRTEPDTIYFNEFMSLLREQITPKEVEKKAIVPIGLNPLNQVMYMDLNDSIAHILVAGTTGSGKSVSLNSIVLSMMCLYSPQNLRFVFIDPKQVEFSIYERARHTDKVITALEETADYLETLAIEMDMRYSKFKDVFVQNIAGYNELCIENNEPENCLPRIIVVFDEFADFMLQDADIAKRIKDIMMRLGQKSRAAGIHLIVCTQSPKADIIDTSIRNNLSGRLCLKVADSNASNVVLDESGAELLAGKGDYLMKGNSNRIERGMSPFLDSRTQRALLQYFSN